MIYINYVFKLLKIIIYVLYMRHISLFLTSSLSFTLVKPVFCVGLVELIRVYLLFLLFMVCFMLCYFNQIKLVTDAIKMDDASELKEAAQLYCEAMAFFLPAIERKSVVSHSHFLCVKYIKTVLTKS